MKDYGNFLVYPSDAVKKTVENCEKVILIEIQNGEWLKKKYFLDFLCMKIIKLLVDQTPLILSTFDHHWYDY